VTSGSSSLVGSFADILQVSLAESSDSLKHVGNSLVGETKSQPKSTGKKTDSPAAPVAAPADPTTSSALIAAAIPVAIPAPQPSAAPADPTAASALIAAAIPAAIPAPQPPAPPAFSDDLDVAPATGTNQPDPPSGRTTSLTGNFPSSGAPAQIDASTQSVPLLTMQDDAHASSAGAAISPQSGSADDTDVATNSTSSAYATPSNDISIASESGAQETFTGPIATQTVAAATTSSADSANNESSDVLPSAPTRASHKSSSGVAVASRIPAQTNPVQNDSSPSQIDPNDSLPISSQQNEPLTSQVKSAEDSTATSSHLGVSAQQVPNVTGTPPANSTNAASGAPSSGISPTPSDGNAMNARQTLPSLSGDSQKPANEAKQSANISVPAGMQSSAQIQSFTQVQSPAASAPVHAAHAAIQFEHAENTRPILGNATRPAVSATAANSSLQSQAPNSTQAPSSQDLSAAAVSQNSQVVTPDSSEAGTSPATLASQSGNGIDLSAAGAKRESKSEKVPASGGIAASPGSGDSPLSVDPDAVAPTAITAATQVSDASTFARPSTSAGNTVPAHAPTQTPATSHLPDDGPELSPAMDAWNGGENLQANLTRDPSLVEKVGQSEMSIDMQADALGSVQVRAHLAGDQIGAAITVEHHDVHAMLTSDLPALHQALAERQLRVENLSVNQSYFSADAGIGGSKSGQQQPQDGAAPGAIPAGETQTRFSAEMNFPGNADSSESRGAFDSQGRLSVRA
jgi:flagellar hook-length control protein FliK